VLSGRLLVVGDDAPQEAAPGSMFVAPRGHRDGFSNPSAELLGSQRREDPLRTARRPAHARSHEGQTISGWPFKALLNGCSGGRP